MNELVEAIRVAVATGATTEQKALGAQACRTILAALDATPGKPIPLPGTPPPSPLAGASLDQVLDLVIARLTPIAAARESQAAPVPAPRSAPLLAPPLATRVAPRPQSVPPGGRKR